MFPGGVRWEVGDLSLYDRMRDVLEQAMEDPFVKADWHEGTEEVVQQTVEHRYSTCREGVIVRGHSGPSADGLGPRLAPNRLYCLYWVSLIFFTQHTTLVSNICYFTKYAVLLASSSSSQFAFFLHNGYFFHFRFRIPIRHLRD